MLRFEVLTSLPTDVCVKILILVPFFFFFFKLLAACDKGLILNVLVSYKSKKSQLLAPDTQEHIISRELAVSGFTRNYNPPYQLLIFSERWFLPFPLTFFFFSPVFHPIHLCNFSNLWKWNTAWLVSLEDLPMPKLTHKYLLSSQCFGRRPSVFVLHIAFWSVEWTDLALLFIVHFRFLNMNFQVKRIFFTSHTVEIIQN